MKRLLVGLLVSFFSVSSAFAVGSIHTTIEKIATKTKAYTLAWVCDASGDVNGITVPVKAGILYAIALDPESGVSDLYDLTIVATWKIVAVPAGTVRTIEWADMLGGQGANISNSANGQIIYLTKPFPMSTGTVAPVITNAGNAQSGTLILYFWEE